MTELFMDFIRINGLRVNTIIGCQPGERKRRQGIMLDVEIGADLSKAAVSDNLADTIDYAELEERIHTLAADSKFRMIEALAGAVGRLVLEYKPAEIVRIRIEKPGGTRFAQSATVELEFRR